MAIISGRGGAPGSYVYEGAIASTSGTASFKHRLHARRRTRRVLCDRLPL